MSLGADPYKRDNGRAFCALEWAEFVGRTECAHMIAHFMLEPIKNPASPRKLLHAEDNFKQARKLMILLTLISLISFLSIRPGILEWIGVSRSEGKYRTELEGLNRAQDGPGSKKPDQAWIRTEKVYSCPSRLQALLPPPRSPRIFLFS